MRDGRSCTLPDHIERRNKIICIHFGISSAAPNQLLTLNHCGNGTFFVQN